MPPTAELEFTNNVCLINCPEDCRCDTKQKQNQETEINSNANEIIAKGQHLFSNALRTLRWSKSKIVVNNDETILIQEKCRPIISLKEVADHDSYNDCWIILYDRVYDVTEFLNEVNIAIESGLDWFSIEIIEMIKLHP